ncbi:ADP/ATP-dependent (S)-NAD(P)H-hydrate dehydratase [uncultured Microbacterium sp.]|uniref:ADP-dependent NAD(P)H-hydrate dehydratase n=1 Tax=uncultured Microbacterium sp. TaxID=191216 RepID=UPI00262E4CB6|nr:ADP/ATP-dependent (S)-NAD(P)H-hydrate dehydratase [uncultured Microbacterium sp.]
MTVDTEWTPADVAVLLREPTDDDDKYSRGVVGLRTGSERYPGAAVLGVEAAWRAGAGMVRYLGPARDLVLARRPETVTADGRVQAWVIGSGTDAVQRGAEETAALDAVLAGDVPVVVDAGALDLAIAATAPLVLTPHDREHAALRTQIGLADIPDRRAAARDTAAHLDAVVLLKGATTIITAPDGAQRTVTTGVPWLSTAGTGDVLAGILGTLLAGGDDPFACAASAAWVHGRAGAAASAAHAGGPLVAVEVAEAVASVIGGVLAARRA